MAAGQKAEPLEGKWVGAKDQKLKSSSTHPNIFNTPNTLTTYIES